MVWTSHKMTNETDSTPPEWLRVRIAPDLPRSWMPIAASVVKAAKAIMAERTPRRAVVRVRRSDGQLKVRFFVSPPLPRASASLTSALAEAASKYVANHHFPFALDFEDKPPSAQSIPQGAVIFTWDRLSVSNGGKDRGRDADSAARTEKLLRRLQGTGQRRLLAAPAQDWSKRLDELARLFPNFSAVVSSVLRPHVALTARGIRHRLPPILLVGPPGIGKTKFSQSLCELLGVPPPLVVPIAAESNGAALAGSSTFWSNSSPGQLFEFLAWGHRGHPAVANGLVVIDEVDKTGDLPYNPLGSLYSLLEADTASTFVDQSLPDVVIDASHLRVVCTANELDQIPAPLRSRMLVFEIEPPTPEQARGIVLSMFRAVMKQFAVELDPDLPENLMREATQLEPRRVRMLLESAVASAVCDERTYVEMGDWQKVEGTGGEARRRPIGFLEQSGRK